MNEEAFRRVEPPVTLKKDWVLTQQAFDGLLAKLDGDRDAAGLKYERIRTRLVKYFEWRGVAAPDCETDETINRVARRIDAGLEVDNLNAYFYGVARLVFAESLKSEKRHEEPIENIREVMVATSESETGRRDCLDGCLQRLSAGNRELIIEYYFYERREKIDWRKNLASKLGIPLNALRIRAHRIRLDLERCVRKCVEQQA